MRTQVQAQIVDDNASTINVRSKDEKALEVAARFAGRHNCGVEMHRNLVKITRGRHSFTSEDLKNIFDVNGYELVLN